MLFRSDPVELMRQLLVLAVFLCSIPVWAQATSTEGADDAEPDVPTVALNVDTEIETADTKLVDLRQQVRLLSAANRG